MTSSAIWRWIDATILDLGRQMHWSYLPPLLVYLAAGVSGLTSIVGTFFGAMLIGVLRNGLNLVGVGSYVQQVVLGFVILLAVMLDQYRKRH